MESKNNGKTLEEWLKEKEEWLLLLEAVNIH